MGDRRERAAWGGVAGERVGQRARGALGRSGRVGVGRIACATWRGAGCGSRLVRRRGQAAYREHGRTAPGSVAWRGGARRGGAQLRARHSPFTETLTASPAAAISLEPGREQTGLLLTRAKSALEG